MVLQASNVPSTLFIVEDDICNENIMNISYRGYIRKEEDDCLEIKIEEEGDSLEIRAENNRTHQK